MRSGVLLRVALAVALAVSAVIAPPAPSAEAQVAGLQDARDRAAGLATDLDLAAAAYEELWAAVEQATFELEELERRAQELDDEVRALNLQLADRARDLFKRGPQSSFELLVGEGGPAAAIERAGLASVVQQRDTALLEEASAARIALGQTTALLEVRRAELIELEAEAEEAREAVARELEAAQRRVRGLEALAARQRLIQNARQSGVYA